MFIENNRLINGIFILSLMLPTLMLKVGWEHNSMMEFCREPFLETGNDCLIDWKYSGMIFISWWIPSLLLFSLIYLIFYFTFREKTNEITTQSKTRRSKE